MRRIGLVVSVLSVCGLVTGCGDDKAGIVVDGADTVSFDADSNAGDTVVFEDTTFEGNLPDDFAQACRDNRDCESGWCVDGPNGFVCTISCIESCPTDYGCKGVTNGGVDVVFLCVPDGDPIPTDTGTADTTPLDTTPPDTTPPADTTPPDTTDTSTPPDTDTGEPPVSSVCDPDPTIGAATFRVENSDWPDCIVDCPRSADFGFTEIDLRGELGFTGGLGTIDNAVHTLPGSLAGPDIDVIAIRADPRTMIEFGVVAGVNGASIDPLIYTSDGFKIRTYNGDVGANNRCARTNIAFPYVSQSAIYLIIEDTVNYEAWSPNGYGPTVGGSGYGYSLRIRTTPFAPTELGTIQIGQTLPVGGTLTQGGETRYYRFMAPANGSPSVTMNRTGSTAMDPAMAGFQSTQGQLVWKLAAHDADGNGSTSLGPSAFEACSGACGGQLVEYIFAVFDWNGAAFPGAFSYDLSVRMQ
jgi:hypothetical protein